MSGARVGSGPRKLLSRVVKNPRRRYTLKEDIWSPLGIIATTRREVRPTRTLPRAQLQSL